MPRTILIVDDDKISLRLLKSYLEKHQYEVRSAEDGQRFLAEFDLYQDALSLVILDVMLPDTDGFSLCQIIRQKSKVPIIMLTASSDDTDRIVGLELGADDYMAKPYNPRELLARIKAVHRRMQLNGPSDNARFLRFSGFTMDLVERVLTDDAGQPVVLTSMDFNLLRFFCRARGRNLGPKSIDGANPGTRLGSLGPFAGCAGLALASALE